MQSAEGILYIAALPIGHPADVTQRVLDALKTCDQVLCEDAFKAGTLMKSWDVQAPKYKYPWQANPQKLNEWIRAHLIGKTSVLVSDAGTPGISDPGSRFVSAARENGIQVLPLPGVSALATAVSVCGWQTHPLLYLGFLPPGKVKRQNQLNKYQDFQGLIVLYESVHRIESLLYEVVAEIWGKNTPVFVAREMTKTHEEFALIDLEKPLSGQLKAIKGEFTVIINRTGK